MISKKINKIFLILVVLSAYLFPQDFVETPTRIAILYSELTEKIDRSNSIKVIDVITAWELFLMQEKILYSVIYDDDLKSGIEDDFDILILPSVKYISEDQYEELQKFLAMGGSIISAGSKLGYKQNDLNEYQNLETLFGLINIKTIPNDRQSYLHSIVPNHLNQFRSNEEVVLQISNKEQALYSDNFENQKSFYGYIFYDDEPNSIRSSIIYGKVGAGRFLWTGFDINEVIGGSEDLKEFKGLILNSLRWMDNKVDAYIASFPESLSNPVVANLQFNNLLEAGLIDVLQKNNIRPNLIVNTDQKVLKEIFNKFNDDEIIIDLSQNNILSSSIVTDIINKFNQEYEVNLSSIIVQKQFLKNNDLSSIQTSGIGKIFYVEEVPGVPKSINKELLSIPFTSVNSSVNSHEVIKYLNYNPTADCKTNPEDELLEKINQLKAQKNNFVTLSDLKKWWSVRDKITIEIKNISENEIELWITNKNSNPINDFNIFLNIPNDFDRKTLTISLNNSLLEYYSDNASGAIIIKLDKIQSNSLSKIKVNFVLD